MVPLLCYAVLFFSLAQPGIYFPDGNDHRLFLSICALAGISVFLSRSAGGTERLKLPQNRFILAMILIYTLSEAQYLWISGTLTTFEFWLKKAILYWIVINGIRSVAGLRRCYWSVLWAVMVLTAFGWNLYDTPLPPDLYDSGIVWDPTRLQSVSNYNNPNSFALLLTCALPLAFSLFEVERNILKRILLIAAMGVLIISCLYTKSRGGAAGMLGALVLCIILSRKVFRWKGLKIVLSIGAVAMFSAVVVSFILTRGDVTGYLGSGGESSAGDRLMAWIAAIKMFLTHPLLGIGWNHFLENCYLYGMDKKIITHNTLLSVLAETGLLGISCFVAILVVTMKQLIAMRRKWEYRPDLEDRLILCNGVWVSLLCFLFNTSFSVKDHDPVYWIILSLAGVLCSLYRQETADEERMAVPFELPDTEPAPRFRASRPAAMQGGGGR